MTRTCRLRHSQRHNRAEVIRGSRPRSGRQRNTEQSPGAFGWDGMARCRRFRLDQGERLDGPRCCGSAGTRSGRTRWLGGGKRSQAAATAGHVEVTARQHPVARRANRTWLQRAFGAKMMDDERGEVQPHPSACAVQGLRPFDMPATSCAQVPVTAHKYCLQPLPPVHSHHSTALLRSAPLHLRHHIPESPTPNRHHAFHRKVRAPSAPSAVSQSAAY